MLSEMASFAACTRESRCTTSRIHQHIEKNSVPLKEVLTGRCASAQRASLARAPRRTHREAGSAASIGIGICRQCRKCLRHSGFFNSNFSSATRCRRCGDANYSSKGAPRGLRVGRFGNEKIFEEKPPTSHRRSPKTEFLDESLATDSQRRLSRRRAIQLATTREAALRASRRTSSAMSPHRASVALRCRASTSGDR